MHEMTPCSFCEDGYVSYKTFPCGIETGWHISWDGDAFFPCQAVPESDRLSADEMKFEAKSWMERFDLYVESLFQR